MPDQPTLAPGQPSMTVAVQTVSTEGNYSIGADIANEGVGTVTLRSGPTLGEGSDGLILRGPGGNTVPNAKPLPTNAQEARRRCRGPGTAPPQESQRRPRPPGLVARAYSGSSE